MLDHDSARSVLSTTGWRAYQLLRPGTEVCSRILAALLLCGVAVPIQGEDNAKNVLVQVRRGVMDTLKRLPKYVCTQTIDRNRYEPDSTRYYALDSKRHVHTCDEISTDVTSATWKRRLSSSDRLRLDVAVNHVRASLDREMYSWAGDDHFSHGDLFEFVRDGSVSTGSFSSMLASIFGSDAASFSYNGDSTVGGRLLAEFGFRVPLERSHYSYILNGGEQQMTLAYSGTFLVDPETSDLVRLVVRTNHTPAESGACELTQTLNYDRVSLHGADFLLPTEARVSLIHTDGTEAENLIKYSACHEFQGESTLRFESSPEAGMPRSGNGPSAGSLQLPPGLPFKLVFTERVDTAVAAAGDPIRAKLKTALRDRSSKVLVPEGAVVTGRIVSMRRFYGPSTSQSVEGQRVRGQRPSLVIKVRLETVDVDGKSYSLKARFHTGFERFAKVASALSSRVEIGNLDTSENSDDGVFEFWDENQNHVVTSGLESNWFTLAH
jgi:hypothetical protein